LPFGHIVIDLLQLCKTITKLSWRNLILRSLPSDGSQSSASHHDVPTIGPEGFRTWDAKNGLTRCIVVASDWFVKLRCSDKRAIVLMSARDGRPGHRNINPGRQPPSQKLRKLDSTTLNIGSRLTEPCQYICTGYTLLSSKRRTGSR
jgi:hypothetical protein